MPIYEAYLEYNFRHSRLEIFGDNEAGTAIGMELGMDNMLCSWTRYPCPDGNAYKGVTAQTATSIGLFQNQQRQCVGFGGGIQIYAQSVNNFIAGIGLTSQLGPLSLTGTFSGPVKTFQNGWGGICYGAFQSSPLCLIGWIIPSSGRSTINVYEIASVNLTNNTGILAVSKTVKLTTFSVFPSLNGIAFTGVLCPGCFTWGANNTFDLNAQLAWFNIGISPSNPVDNPNDPNSNITFTFSQVDHLFAANVATLKTAAATASCPFTTVG
ncbi:hypothetical protein C8J57DRAFT_1245186 [Mycena rebaudengoi]|nr:hypothetical protein C8J57DRAFT_1251743 [Mycena rebaudengoi]KAJ7240748.1 hypothetical protein C8J57DRAFT_1245186 [Mycena rebaudengoi]